MRLAHVFVAMGALVGARAWSTTAAADAAPGAPGAPSSGSGGRTHGNEPARRRTRCTGTGGRARCLLRRDRLRGGGGRPIPTLRLLL